MIRFALFAAVVLFTAQAPAQESKSEYKPTPWHLVDIWWDIGQDSSFESYSIDVDISDDVPSTKNLYISPIGLGHLSNVPFYGGIQTQSDGLTKQDRQLRKLGHGLIFSMWGQRSLDAVRPSVGGFCQSAGNEGDFVSVRRPYDWKKGKYTYKIVKMDKEEVEGQPATWVGAFVYSHEKDENVFIGALRFKGENLVLARKVANFVEIYGPRIPVTEIPKVTVTFGNLRVNGKPVKVAWAEANYPKKVPDYAGVVAKDGALVVTVGKPVENRKERKVRLIGKSTGSKTSFKGWELYVWQKGGDTCFSLLEGTNRLKIADEIDKAAVKGFDAIKPKLDELKPGQEVFLSGKKLLTQPPKEQAAPVVEYGKKIGLKVQ